MQTKVKICPECGEINRAWREHCGACQAILISTPITFMDLIVGERSEGTASEQSPGPDARELQARRKDHGEATQKPTPSVQKKNGSSRVVKGCLMIAFAVLAMLGANEFGETLSMPAQYYFLAGIALIGYAIYYLTRK